jgi:chitodextrinase
MLGRPRRGARSFVLIPGPPSHGILKVNGRLPNMTDARRRVSLLAVALLGLVLAAPAGAAAAGPSSFQGQLHLAHGDDFSHGRATYDYSLTTADGSSYSLAFNGGRGPANFLNGATVQVGGSLSGHTVTVSNSKLVSPATVVASTTKRIALMLVNFVANPSQPWTIAQAQGILFSNTNSVANYFADESYGSLSMTGDVLGYYTISFDTTGRNYTDLANKTNTAAQAAGVNLSSYTNIQYAFPSLPCGWAGLGMLPGSQTWLNQALDLRVSSHELSHNFGTHHASTWDCTESGVRVALSANLANCVSSEYGDPFGVMGSAFSYHTHSEQLVTMGFLPLSATQTVSTSGTYALNAAEDSAGATRAIRVARGDGTYLCLELREPWPTFDTFNTTDPAVKGVTLRVTPNWTTMSQSHLIDTTPATGTFADAPLAVGSRFTDPLSGVTVTDNSVAGGVASVDITWGPDTIAPSQPGSLSARAAGATTATLSWAASTDNIGVAGYRVSRGGTLLGTVTTTSYADSGLIAGSSYGYSVVAFDGAGNSSQPATLTWVQPTPDTTAPTQPTNLHTTALSKAKFTLAWTASTDNVGIAGYRVYRNGALAATVDGTTTSYSGGRQNKSATYYVVAFDATGNVSPQSSSITF